MASEVELRQHWEAVLSRDGGTGQELFVWMAQHVDQFPDGYRTSLVAKCRYVVSQAFELMCRDGRMFGSATAGMMPRKEDYTG
jgi:hypothetical protein